MKATHEWVTTEFYSFQVNVPHSVYGKCEWFMPKDLDAWLTEHGLSGSYTGGGSWGNGFTNGITNHESSYIIRNAQESDGLAFKLQFPKCKVHISEQFDLKVL